jgi:lysophospholipid acyltransferase (LPLAT)-like uncharacterized protein
MKAGMRRWLVRACAAYVRTWRVRVATPEGRAIRIEELSIPHVAVVCERDMFAMAGLAAAGAMILISPGRDGDWGSALARELGCEIVRGSARHRPAAALRELARRVGPALPVLMFADGPLGPADVVKPGVIATAVFTARALRPYACAAAWAVRVPGTWSGMYVPLPFSRVVVIAGDIMTAEHADTREGRRVCAEATGAALARARQLAWSAVR